MTATADQLKSLHIITFESRFAATMADLLSKYGAQVTSAPAMQEIPLSKNPEVFSFGELLLNNKIDYIIFSTGVGARVVIDVLKLKFKADDIVSAFNRSTVIVRGPKSKKVLSDLKIKVQHEAALPFTSHEVIEILNDIDLKNKTVAIQEYGERNLYLERYLDSVQAKTVRVPVYRWALPDNTTPLEEAIHRILNREVDVLVFTNATQVEHLMEMGRRVGHRDALIEKINQCVVASVGPTTTECCLKYGFGVDIEPDKPKMNPLAEAVAEWAPKQIEKKSNTGVSGQLNSRSDQLENALLLRACRLERTERPPIWLMRQAGRYMKSYREIREKIPFLELCKRKDLVTEITVGAQEVLGVDAAIIFADLLLIVDALGLGLSYVKQGGPKIHKPVKSFEDVKKLPKMDMSQQMSYLFEAIQLTRQKLQPHIPLIGFAGAPFTVAAYMIEGGQSKGFQKTKQFMRQNEMAWHELLERLTKLTIEYVKLQIQAGVQVIQIFDSWVGCLGSDEYERYVVRHSRELLKQIQGEVPVIHFGTNNNAFFSEFVHAGGDVIGVDYRCRIAEADKIVGPGRGIQGNLDPTLLFADQKEIEKQVIEILEQMKNRPGFIFNLGHGILPGTPEENVHFLIKTFKQHVQKNL